MLILISYQSTNIGNSRKDISHTKEKCRTAKFKKSFTYVCRCIHTYMYTYIYL